MALGILRFVLSFWVGAATLFVVTGVREVTSDIDPAIKNQLAAIRFPAFYLFAFSLVGIASLAAVVVVAKKLHHKARTIAVFCALSIIVVIVDYHVIYGPLVDLMSDPNARETAEFKSYHTWSKYINFVMLACCLIAACMSLCSHKPESLSQSRDND